MAIVALLLPMWVAPLGMAQEAGEASVTPPADGPAPAADDAWQTVVKVDTVKDHRIRISFEMLETDRLRILITGPSGREEDDSARVGEAAFFEGALIHKPSAVRTDSTAPGFKPEALTDGDSEVNDAPPRGWLSAKLPQSTPRWIEYAFPKPMKFDRLSLTTAPSVTHRLRSFEVQAPKEGAGGGSAGANGARGATSPPASSAKSTGLKPWTLGPPIPRRSSRVTPLVSIGNWLVCVDGTNDDCYGARQLADGKLSPWQTLSGWGFGGVNHGNGNVLLGDVAFNVGISGYTRRIQVQGDSVSRWEFPVPGDKIDPKDDRPREMVWGGAAALTVEGRTFIYYLGGFEYRGGLGQNPTSLDVVYVAETQGRDGLGAWRATTPLPYPAMAPRGVGYNGRVYVLGGRSRFQVPDKFHAGILMASPSADGSIPKWEMAGTMPLAMEGVIAFAHADYMYLIGGASSRSHAECWRAPIGKTGKIGGWQPQPPLPKPVALSNHGIIGRYVYVAGELEDNKSSLVFISRL